MSEPAQQAVRKVEDHPATEALARLGLVSYSLVHLLVGLALLVAWSGSGEDASSSGP